MAGLFETVTTEDPTFVSSSEINANAAAQSADNAKQSEDLSKSYSEQTAVYAEQAKQSSEGISTVLDSVTVLKSDTQTLHDDTQVLHDETKINHDEVLSAQANVQVLADTVRVDRDTVNVAMQNVAISANNAESYSTTAESARDEAKAVLDSVQDVASSVNGGVELSRDWATKMDGKVSDEDYSAKYWADQAKQSVGGGVTSFNGRIGNIAPQTGDYTPQMVGALPSSTTLVPPTRTINGKALSADIVLTPADIGVSSDTAPINSPNFIGIPTAPTASRTTISTQIATTAYVNQMLATSAESKAAASATIAATPSGVREFMEQYGITAAFNSASTDLNGVVKGVFYTWDNNTLNTPVASSYGRGWCIASDANNITQYAIVNGTGKFYTRYKASGSWGAWIALNPDKAFVVVSNPGGTAFPTANFSIIPMYTVNSDVNGYWSTNTFTAPRTGVYLFDLELRFDGATTTIPDNAGFVIKLDVTSGFTNAQVPGQSFSDIKISRATPRITTPIQLSAGAKMSAFVWHNATGNITLNYAYLKITEL